MFASLNPAVAFHGSARPVLILGGRDLGAVSEWPFPDSRKAAGESGFCGLSCVPADRRQRRVRQRGAAGGVDGRASPDLFRHLA